MMSDLTPDEIAAALEATGLWKSGQRCDGGGKCGYCGSGCEDSHDWQQPTLTSALLWKIMEVGAKDEDFLAKIYGEMYGGFDKNIYDKPLMSLASAVVRAAASLPKA